MQKGILSLFFMLLLMLAPPTKALVGGHVDKGMPAVVPLYTVGFGKCTGALVGLNPPTVITARHCVSSNSYSMFNVFPEKVVTLEYPNPQFSPSTLAGDVAVLIFPKYMAQAFNLQPQDLFSVAPMEMAPQDEVSVCGYGAYEYTAVNPKTDDVKRCGTALLVMEYEPFRYETFLKKTLARLKSGEVSYEALSENETLKMTHAFLQAYLSHFGGGTRYGIARFTQDAFRYDPKAGFDIFGEHAILNNGDSGGPWFVKSENKNPRLIAITSGAIGTPTENKNIVANFAWRMDHPWTIELLKRAASEGASINGLESLIYKK